MPRSYAPQIRAMVIEQVRAGRRVAEVAAELELCQGTVFRWVRQDRIDRGELAGTESAWVPWRLRTLEVRMEHGINQQLAAAVPA
jgi:transposase-like protein